MSKITILGASGMLGWALGKYFIKQYGKDNVFLSFRNTNISYGKNYFYFDAMKHKPSEVIPSCHYVINAIGIVKPLINKWIPMSIYINSLFPWELADSCEERDIRLIHITTDCVYGSSKGNYIETDECDCTDWYGRTKSLGEPSNCMNLRTSIIGEEYHNNVNLLEWAVSQKGRTVQGYTNHFWNGVTTQEYARICDKIIRNNWYEKGVFHVFSNQVSKHELLQLINEKWKLSLNIEKFEAPQYVNRTLSTIKSLRNNLQIPTIQDQIENYECYN